MAFPVLQSKDGRVQRVVTSKEEMERYKSEGYTEVGKKHASTERESIDSGAEGNLRARESSTTEGSERNSGTTVRRSRES